MGGFFLWISCLAKHGALKTSTSTVSFSPEFIGGFAARILLTIQKTWRLLA